MNSWEEMYQSTPPWDIGKPQPEFVKLEKSGKIQGQILDVGCGAGENTLFFSEKGYDITGVDFTPSAIAMAKQRAKQRHLNAKFIIQNVLELSNLQQKFDTLIDSGVFHVFDDGQRVHYVKSLGSVLREQGIYYMLVFSDQEPLGYGPRRISQLEIQEAFRDGWDIQQIREARMEQNLSKKWAQAWLVSIIKL